MKKHGTCDWSRVSVSPLLPGKRCRVSRPVSAQGVRDDPSAGNYGDTGGERSASAPRAEFAEADYLPRCVERRGTAIQQQFCSKHPACDTALPGEKNQRKRRTEVEEAWNSVGNPERVRHFRLRNLVGREE